MIFVVLILLCGCTKTANKDSANKKMHSFDLIMQQVDDSMAVNPNYALRLINNSFLIATPLGYRKVHFKEIGYFEYNKDKRLWQAMLVNKSSLTLKVNTKAESILNVSETFFKISKQHIINLSY